MSVKVTKSGPGLKLVRKQLQSIKESDVLIGIPASTTERKSDEEINNASLLYLHTNGSPINNIPARPVLEPSIKANKGIITPHLGNAAAAALRGRPDQAQSEMNIAGSVAANGAKKWFTDPRNNWPPDAPSTVEAKGSDKPLIDTAAMRRAITFVVRQSGNERSSAEPAPAQGPSTTATPETPASTPAAPAPAAASAIETAAAPAVQVAEDAVI